MNEQHNSEKLIAFADKSIGIDRHLESLTRGREYIPLFYRGEIGEGADRISLWLNAWIVTDDHVAESERSEEHLQGRYIQHGFHPGYGTHPKGHFYETIYGGPAEPLSLGWSADDRKIEGDLSQEFERAYKLARRVEGQRTVWNSWQEAIDDVVVREQSATSTSMVAREDFVRDFQSLRQRWLLIGFYAEFGDRLNMSGENVWALKHLRENQKVHYFARAGSSGYHYIELQGYNLMPPPKDLQFSLTIGKVPEGVRRTAEKIEFQTSDGRVRPWEVKERRHQSEHFSAYAVFDQAVLNRYQDDPEAEITTDHLRSLMIRSSKVSLSGTAFLLGTEYVSVWLGDFTVGIPASEWAHWQAFNIPFVGNQKQRDMVQAPSLFDFVQALETLPIRVNKHCGAITSAPEVPFKSQHNLTKDKKALSRALSPNPGAIELVNRAKSLDGLVTERISETGIRIFLNRHGYSNSKRLEDLRSLKLFTSFIAVCRIASMASSWHKAPEEALQYAIGRVEQWAENQASTLLKGEEEAIDAVMSKGEILFLINDLRQLSAHAMSEELTESVKDRFVKHGCNFDQNRCRAAILELYQGLIDYLAACARF